MTARRITDPEAFHQGIDCQVENEWCHYAEPHEHGGFACETTCPCRDAATAQRLGVEPQPTAAQVLAAHVACYGGSDEAYAVTCSCDRYGRPMGYAGLDGVKVHAAHQADMLAGAGLLMTPEAVAAVVNSIGYVADIPLLAAHDAEVAARAWDEAAARAARCGARFLGGNPYRQEEGR